jgi:hypothetical protein
MLVLGKRFMIWFAFHVGSCIRERIVASILSSGFCRGISLKAMDLPLNPYKQNFSIQMLCGIAEQMSRALG